MAIVRGLRHHEELGQMVRQGSWADHCRPTYDLFVESLAEGDLEGAADLARYTLQEAQEPVDLYLAWLPQIRGFLTANGTDPDLVKVEAKRIRAVVANGAPDGYDPEAGWQRVRELAEAAASFALKGQTEEAAKTLEKSRLVWLDTHDRLCDEVQGMIGLTAELLGEERIGELWEILMAPMFDSYDRYDIDRTPWPVSAELLLQVTAEALRGHLTGPDRRGSLELIEEEDRIGFRFRPCGSGGRNFTGETYDSYPLTTKPHDWAWNLEGVCLYCAHCCALSEVNPIRRFGYPAREVEPPFRNADGARDHCTWWIYRDPAKVPETVYRRTGNGKPTEFGGSATRARGKGNGDAA